MCVPPLMFFDVLFPVFREAHRDVIDHSTQYLKRTYVQLIVYVRISVFHLVNRNPRRDKQLV